MFIKTENKKIFEGDEAFDYEEHQKSGNHLADRLLVNIIKRFDPSKLLYFKPLKYDDSDVYNRYIYYLDSPKYKIDTKIKVYTEEDIYDEPNINYHLLISGKEIICDNKKIETIVNFFVQKHKIGQISNLIKKELIDDHSMDTSTFDNFNFKHIEPFKLFEKY